MREVLCDCQKLMQAADGVAVVTQVKCEVEQNYAKMAGCHSAAHESAREQLLNHSKVRELEFSTPRHASSYQIHRPIKAKIVETVAPTPHN